MVIYFMNIKKLLPSYKNKNAVIDCQCSNMKWLRHVVSKYAHNSFEQKSFDAQKKILIVFNTYIQHITIKNQC